jgi:hypothetical protein
VEWIRDSICNGTRRDDLEGNECEQVGRTNAGADGFYRTLAE